MFFDENIAKYLRATGRGELAELAHQNIELLSVDDEVKKNPESYYDRVVEIDLSKLEPHVVGPHSPDRARPLSKLAQEVKESDEFLDEISTCLIGSCTNSSYEDKKESHPIKV